MLPPTKHILIGAAALALAAAIPAIAQDRPESILPAGVGDPATPAPAPEADNAAPAPRSERQSIEASAVVIVESLLGNERNQQAAGRQVEYPAAARCDPYFAGPLDPSAL